jgi:hypothetical protein
VDYALNRFVVLRMFRGFLNTRGIGEDYHETHETHEGHENTPDLDQTAL